MMKFCNIFVRVKSSAKPPFFIGSQIRGALGYALKEVVCVSDDKKCQSCNFCDDCVYFEFYEQKNAYHAYRLDFELGAQNYAFSVILFEKAAQNAPLIIAALHKMLSEIGIDNMGARTRFRDFEIFVNNKICFDGSALNFPNEFSANLAPRAFRANLALKFLTPLRIKKHNAFANGENLEIGDIFNSIFQRKCAILGLAREKSPRFCGEISHKILRRIELYRKSNRQQSKMQFGGIIGEIRVENLNNESFELLCVGEILGVGKQCVFGLGKMVLE